MRTRQILERIAKAIENQSKRDVMNAKETAEYLGISVSFLEKLKQSYAIPFCRIGGRVVYRRNDLDKYLDSTLVTGPDRDGGMVSYDKQVSRPTY